jgi:cysteinyl-tRNA synthetase
MPLPPIHVYNTLTRSVELLEPAEPGHVRMYVCGMTVYDHCHIGHARAMMAFDVVYRHLRHRGYTVTYVRNHTDVDDKILARAVELGMPPLELSAEYIGHLDADLDALGLARPTHEPKVSDHVDGIVALVADLVDRDHAYAAGGDVFFAVSTFDGYGKLSGRKLEDLRCGERVEVNPDKRDPADFVLWKGAKEGEISWPSPWGPGRPGWHIECSAMSMHHLGKTFDVHGGGIDLVFPHHENEIAQSEAGTGEAPFSKVWMHNGHLTLVGDDGQDIKMSKSLGNVVRIRDLLEEVPAEVLRLVYLETHYRSPLPYSNARVAEATTGLARLYEAKELVETLAVSEIDYPPERLAEEAGKAALQALELIENFEQRFNAAMDHDFNSGQAIGTLFELVRAINRAGNHKRVKKLGGALLAPAELCFALAGRVLGIGGSAPKDFFEELREKRLKVAGLDSAWVEERLKARLAARESKDWGAADQIRDELDAVGVVVMDRADGVTWRVKV